MDDFYSPQHFQHRRRCALVIQAVFRATSAEWKLLLKIEFNPRLKSFQEDWSVSGVIKTGHNYQEWWSINCGFFKCRNFKGRRRSSWIWIATTGVNWWKSLCISLIDIVTSGSVRMNRDHIRRTIPLFDCGGHEPLTFLNFVQNFPNQTSVKPYWNMFSHMLLIAVTRSNEEDGKGGCRWGD